MKIIRIIFVLILFFSFIVSYSYASGLLTGSNVAHRPFSLTAKKIGTWKKGGVRVFMAEKNAEVLQGQFHIVADTVVCWFHEEVSLQSEEAIIEVYCEGSVTLFQGEHYEKFEQVYLRFVTITGIEVNSEVQPVEAFEEPQVTRAFLRGEAIRAKGEEEYFSMEIPENVKLPGQREEQELINIVADQIDSWEEKGKRVIVALGNVKIKKKDMEVDADSVILWLNEKEENQRMAELPLSEIYAEGNVNMRSGEDLLIADNKGILINSKIKTKVKNREGGFFEAEELPAHISAEEIRHTGRGQYELRNGIVTTCGYGHPHYHFKGKKIRLIQSGKHNIVSSKHNSFYIGKYPVAYFPYMSLDIRKERLLKEWEFGSSSRFGTFFRTDWDLYVATGGKQKEWSDLILELDYLQERGIGTGLDFNYTGSDRFGFLDTYYLNDQGDRDINRIPIDEEDRGSILWRHRQELAYDWRLDVEYSHLSDPRFLFNFFEHEFKEEKDRETVMYFRRIKDNKAATFLVNQQFNGFDTMVDSLRKKNYAERLPEAKYLVVAEPFWNNRLIFSSESSATYFNNSIEQSDEAQSLDTAVETQPLTRVDNVARVSIPFKPWVFHIKPFVEGRATGYTKSIDTSSEGYEEDDQITGRFITSFGLDWSSTHWRTYSVYNEFFKINRLRHIFTPELRYIYSPVVTTDPSELFQYDEIDALDSSQVVVFGIKNRLQTKRGRPGYKETVNFVDFNIDYYMFPTNSGIYTKGINGINIRRDDFINFDLRFQLNDTIKFISERNEFNTEELQFDVLTYGIELANPPDWQYFIGHRFIRDISSTIILAADYRISEKWSVKGLEKFDLKSSLVEDSTTSEKKEDKKNLKTSFVLSRYFHDWVGSLILELDPLRKDNSFRFDITPRGLQEKSKSFWF